jgi:hypothetical protein
MSLEMEVVSVLGSDYVKNLKPFTFGAISYDPASDLTVVSQYITLGNIRVEHKPKMKAAAMYKIESDSIYLRNETLTGIENRAIVVHEAVHAWQDMLRLGKISAFASEGAAFLVQMMFLAQQVSKGERLTSHRSDLDNVYKVAWNLAEKLLAGKKTDKKEFAALNDAVAAVSEYAAEDKVNRALLSQPWV